MFYEKVSKNSLTPFLVISSLLMTVSPIALAESHGGGSGGGTNIDKTSKELVEFKRTGKRVRIDPRTFEGIYSELVPRLRAIEEKIPGLGKQLEVPLDDRSWFITDQEFPPRNENEEKPIHQDENHVFLTAHKVEQMGREELKKAFFHEMVRGHVQNVKPMKMYLEPGSFVSLSQEEVDKLVEDLTVVLYFEYDIPARVLARLVNQALGRELFVSFRGKHGMTRGYISQPEIDERIQAYYLKEKYLGVCRKVPNIIGKNILSRTTCNGMELDGDNPDTFVPYVQKCFDANTHKEILQSLNELKEVERSSSFSNRDKNYLFRASLNGIMIGPGSGSKLHDLNSANPSNGAEWIDQFESISTFNRFLSDAILGRVTDANTGERKEWSAEVRVLFAIIGCSKLTPDAELMIVNSKKAGADQLDPNSNVLKTLAEVNAVLGMPSAGSEATPKSTGKLEKRSPIQSGTAPESATSRGNSTNATDAR